ncbi:hypothetical protein SIID45300_00525 [Candidatus Magnetaquicoccaceae bacterium FCR-1]|uniref:Uncharacterized protein n=1 Tax=Candidatus Magnetaquiglobus chichijimensis TaxID=3141448 RepID=A0ABQ0C5R0_9PROT
MSGGWAMAQAGAGDDGLANPTLGHASTMVGMPGGRHPEKLGVLLMMDEG